MLALTGALALGCDPATYTDQNFGTNLGADYMEPTRDADTDDAAGSEGAGGVAGTGGAAGQFGASGSGF